MEARIEHWPATFDRVDLVKQAVGRLVLPGDDRLWILGDELVIRVNAMEVTVPRGFVTDGASIPRLGQLLTGWGPWDEPQRLPAIVHDWLYCQRDTARTYADRAFRALLASEDAGWFRRTVMYWAVVLGGGSAYRIDQRQGPMIYA